MIREWLYGDSHCIPRSDARVPTRLREADHHLRNEVASLDAAFHRLKRDYPDPLEELVRRAKEGSHGAGG